MKTSSYAKLESPLLRWLVRSPLGALALHWTFQGLLYMDPTERWFKIALDAGLTLLLGAILLGVMPWFAAWPVGFLLAHTLNFLFNGQLWGVLKHYGLVNHTLVEFEHYVESFRMRAQLEPSVRYLAIYGSLSRQEWTPQADLDARIVRSPGFKYGLHACLFLLRERTRALLSRFPLDIYVLDSFAGLHRLSVDESPVVLFQQDEA